MSWPQEHFKMQNKVHKGKPKWYVRIAKSYTLCRGNNEKPSNVHSQLSRIWWDSDPVQEQLAFQYHGSPDAERYKILCKINGKSTAFQRDFLFIRNFLNFWRIF